MGDPGQVILFISMFYFEPGGRSAKMRCGHFSASGNRMLVMDPRKSGQIVFILISMKF